MRLARFAPLTLLVLVATSGVLCAEGAPLPRIVLEDTGWDFGEIDQGRVVKKTFVIQNQGDANLILRDVESTCGCTVPRVPREPIPPGGSVELEITFDSKARKGDQNKTVGITSNDPARPKVNITIKGKVLVPPAPVIEALPYRLDFESLLPGASRSATLTVRNVGERDLTLHSVVGTLPELTVEAIGEQTIAPDGKLPIQVTMTIPEKALAGYIERYLILRSNDPNQSELRLPCVAYVTGVVNGRLLLPAGDIDLGVLTEADAPICHIPFSNGGAAPLTIAKVEVSGSSARVIGTEGRTLAPHEILHAEVRTSFNLVQGTFRDRVMVAVEAADGTKSWKDFYVTGYVARTVWK